MLLKFYGWVQHGIYSYEPEGHVHPMRSGLVGASRVTNNSSWSGGTCSIGSSTSCSLCNIIGTCMRHASAVVTDSLISTHHHLPPSATTCYSLKTSSTSSTTCTCTCTTPTQQQSCTATHASNPPQQTSKCLDQPPLLAPGASADLSQ